MRDFTVKQVQAAGPGRHRVSQSLYLYVSPNGQTRRWIFRYTKPGTGKVTETGLGSSDVVTLAEAKAKAHDYRRMVAQGGDPVEQKRGQRTASVTFADVASEYIEVQARRFRNPNSVKNIRMLLLTHAEDLADKPIAEVGTAHIDTALRPLWLRAPDQARRAVAACLRVVRFAKAKGLTTTSAAEMREDMAHLLPPVKGEKRHFAAIDYEDVPAFVRELRAAQTQGEALSPVVLEFILLTACRENEACGMQWREIDWAECVWTLASRTGQDARTPGSAVRPGDGSAFAPTRTKRNGRASRPRRLCVARTQRRGACHRQVRVQIPDPDDGH